MTQQSLRKTRMRLLASLYEVASRFTEKELIEVRDALDEESRWLNSVAGALLALHNSVPSTDVPRSSPQKPAGHSREGIHSPRRRESALRQLLLSKELFASPKDIFASVPGAVPLRAKESREKYVNRILAEFRTLTLDEQIEFTDAVQKRLVTSSKTNFVSKWTRLIREL